MTLYDVVIVQLLHRIPTVPFQVTSISIASLARSGGGDNSSASYRIPEGEAATSCHTVDTCDQCVGTVEAWQDLITDQIEEPWIIILIHLISSDSK